MAHQQQIEFCSSVKGRFPDFFCRKLVLDIGSLDINGNNQYLFDDCLYLGVDLAPGKNVDFASKGHELNLPSECADVVVSTECFEHDRYYALTLQNIVRMLKPGGLFLFSCATTGRPEHGTRRTTPSDAPLTHQFDDWGDYYKNLEEGDIRLVLDIEHIFSKFAFSINDETHDLYFWGIKKGSADVRNDYSFLLRSDRQREQIASLNQAVAERSGQLTGLNQLIVEREAQIAGLNQLAAERDGQIGGLNQLVAERDAQIADINQLVADRDSEVVRLNSDAVQRNEQIASLNRVVGAQEGEIVGLRHAIAEREGELARVLMSRSWRITKPLRYVGRLIASLKTNGS